jgi:hypothetical protein
MKQMFFLVYGKLLVLVYYSKSDIAVTVDGHCTLSTRTLYLLQHGVKMEDDEQTEINDRELLT